MNPEQMIPMLMQALQQDIENYASEATELVAEYAPMTGVVVGGVAALTALTWGARKLFAAEAPKVVEVSKAAGPFDAIEERQNLENTLARINAGEKRQYTEQQIKLSQLIKSGNAVSLFK